MFLDPDAGSGDRAVPARSIVVWSCAALGAALSILVLYPGQYPFDSAYQLWQARSGNYSNLSPVTMPVLWSVLLKLGGNPASLFCLNLAMVWAGIALCADALRWPAWLRGGFVLACGLWPLTLVQMAHLLSDAHLAAVLVLATGLVADAAIRRGRATAWIALGLLIYAGSIRHNALLAVVPFAAVLVALLSREGRAPRMHRAIAVIALVMASALVGIAIDRIFVIERKVTWPTVALWDIAAVSVAVDELLLPPFTHGPGMSAAELRETGAFNPTSNIYLFTSSRSGIGGGITRPFPPDELAQLRRAWWSAATAHGSAYPRHRIRTFGLLAGPRTGPHQGASYYVDRVAFQDNPELPQPLAADLQWRFYAFAESVRSSLWFNAVPALVLIVVAVVLAWRRRGMLLADVAFAAALSMLLYAGSFLVLAPSAELRYLTWPIVAAPLALALAVMRRPRTGGRRSRAENQIGSTATAFGKDAGCRAQRS